MKENTKRIVCFLIVASMMLSLFTVFASADGGKGEKKETATDIFYNRDFEEGWDYTNGLKAQSSEFSDLRLEKEYGSDLAYNYFLCIEAFGSTLNDMFFANLPNTRINDGKYFLEFDIKTESTCNFGDLLMFVTPGSGNARILEYILSINNGVLNLLGKDCCEVNGNEWIHVGFMFDFNEIKDVPDITPLDFKISAVWSDEHDNSGAVNKNFTAGLGGKGIQQLRMGYSAGSEKTGWVGIDNLKMYKAEEFCELPEDDYGTLVNENADKDFPIIKDANDTLPFDEKLKDSWVMKKNVENCLLGGKRKPIYEKNGKKYGAPTEINGEIMISLEVLLDYIGYPYFIHPDGQSFDISTGTSATYLTVGRTSANVGGERVELKVAPGYITANGEKYLSLALSDVEKLFPGIHVVVDSMGLIIVTRYAGMGDYLGINKSMDIMKDFVFDVYTDDEVYEMTKKKTNNFTHPYLMATQDRFDELRALYNLSETDEKYDEQFVKNVNTVLDDARNRLLAYSEIDDDGHYVRIKPEKVPVNRNYEKYPDGYDAGGNCGVNNKFLPTLAFAYQMTLDENYVYLIYDWIIAIGKWPHWGPAHFLNCADATWPTAISLDWTYNAMKELGLSAKACVQILYEKGVHAGYLGTTDQPNPFAMNRLFRDASHYTRRTNNWNAVCTSGIVIGSLCVMGEPGNSLYREESTYIVSHNTQTLPEYGMGQYAPDGSYVESSAYWQYGTNSFYRMLMALDSAVGTDFGLMDCWGLDRTCYFACQIEDADFHSYSYHDGNTNPMDTSFFPFVGLYMNDLAIVSIRKSQVKNGKRADMWDTIYYVPDDNLKDVELPLDYYMEGIDGYAMRSSWEKGSMYAGIMGGDNHASHGQIDAGAFVYHNKHRVWIYDLGGDNYYMKGYFSDFRYYKRSSEGNNTLVMTDVPSLHLGQKVDTVCPIIDHYTNEFGTYAILDNTDAFDGLATYWRRGMMATNDRNTVVVQDEVSLKGIRTLYWFAHYSLGLVDNVKITPDGRTAYLTSKPDSHGLTETLRLSIVSPSLDFKFEVMDCYTFVLDGTHPPEYAISQGQPERDRKGFNKLAIKAENVLSFNLSVVLEVISPSKEVDVGYEWTEMKDWEPVKDNRGESTGPVEVSRDTAKMTDIPNKLKAAENMLSKGIAYTEKIENYYRTICDLEYACIAFEQEDLSEDYIKHYRRKKEIVGEYNTFVKEANQNFEISRNFIGSIIL